MTVGYAAVNFTGRGLGMAYTSDSDAELTYLRGIAEKRVAIDAPATMDATLRDHCTALMICHLYAAADPAFGMRSFSSGDMSGSQDAGSTIYLIEYRQIIEDSQLSVETTGDVSDVARSDSVMKGLQLDDQRVPTYFTGVTD
jgi:hypothetical protein